MTVGELKKTLERSGDGFLVHVCAGDNNNPLELPVLSVASGLDASVLGLETGPLTPAQRSVLLNVGEPLDPDDGGVVPGVKGARRAERGPAHERSVRIEERRVSK